MKKLVSYVLLLATMLNIFVVSASASTASSAETFYINGEQYTLENIVTDKYSQAVTKDCNGVIVADFSFDFTTGNIVDNFTGDAVSRTRQIKNQIVPFADSSKYKYRYTDRYTFDLLGKTAPYAATGIIVLVTGGNVAAITAAKRAFLIDALAGLIAAGCNAVDVEVDVFTYTENHYFHYKFEGFLCTQGTSDRFWGPLVYEKMVREK